MYLVLNDHCCMIYCFMAELVSFSIIMLEQKTETGGNWTDLIAELV